MALSKWSIHNNGKFLRNDASAIHPAARIVYLDDHQLIRNAIVEYCIRPFFGNIPLVIFTNGNEAFEYLKEQLNLDIFIDLFITDINHPGMRGNDLAKQIRLYEQRLKRSRSIPILIISMVDPTTYPELLTQKIVDAWLTKAAEVEDIVACIEELLYVW